MSLYARCNNGHCNHDLDRCSASGCPCATPGRLYYEGPRRKVKSNRRVAFATEGGSKA